MNDTSNPAVVANTSFVVVNDRAHSLDFNGTQLGATTVQVNATNCKVHVEPVPHLQVWRLQLKVSMIILMFCLVCRLKHWMILINSLRVVKLVQIRCGLNWKVMFDTMAMGAVCGLSEAFKAETIAKSTTPKPTYESPVVQAVDINANAPSYAGVTRMAFPVVEYYARNNWAKHSLKRIMMNSKGFFFFKFDTQAGLEAVESGRIDSHPSMVKLHDVPIQVFEEDGISLIATFIGKPCMLDSYTSSMCKDSWGRGSFARCLIEVSSEAELVELLGRVVSPPVVPHVITPTAVLNHDGFQTFRYVPKAATSEPKKGATTMGNASKSSSILKSTGNSSKEGNITTSNLYSALVNDEEHVENVYDESANLFTNPNTGESSSFTNLPSHLQTQHPYNQTLVMECLQTERNIQSTDISVCRPFTIFPPSTDFPPETITTKIITPERNAETSDLGRDPELSRSRLYRVSLDGETTTEFMTRFTRLAGFITRREGRKFKWALNGRALDRLVNTEFTDVAHVANATRNIEILRDTHLASRQKGNNKRNKNGHHIRPT
ncbi:ATPase, F1/V1/A1 complex, alpha/beta subunit, Zinc knuckle CX2CX4HX4C [Artemisia annua]|uniref:ATPase, F1/V1/A1 complex, alpha/beta subunit, Zinc knuckle CX2CX4HX4C n=1 Tax=Artemisia annua TaxID=35608 RepID=A0A2U1PUE0_ARTAN|nr:ATPase, F1/V1/A1 complex, alpha/beta subunit, Zinc knuckle CX2CX4HX4C [Artemisia annua]